MVPVENQGYLNFIKIYLLVF